MGHHYVPQEYLRGFTHPSCPKALWQFDKETQRFSAEPASIAKIAQQRSFYDDDTERMLNQLVEIPGNRVLHKLVSGDHDLTHEERLDLSVYIATMLTRVPHRRAKATEMAPQVLANVTSDLRDQTRVYADAGNISPETAAKRLAAIDAAEAKYSADMPANVRDQIRSPWPPGRMIHFVYRMRWRLVPAIGRQYFVTTDNPAFFFECCGLGTERSELTFPVSAKLAIFGSWTPLTRNNRIDRPVELVKEANRRLISQAARFVYYRSKADWIATVAAKDKPRLSRIQW